LQGLSTFLVAFVAVLAAMLAGHLALSRSQGRGLAFAFLLAFALQSGLLLVQLLQPGILPAGLRAATGSALPVLLYLFFARSRLDAGPWQWRDALHVLPVLVVVGMVALPDAGWRIDVALLLIELSYALAILSGDRRDAVGAWRRQARLAAAGFLLAMAASDVWIGWELAQGATLGWSTSLAAALLVLIASIATLFAVAWRDPEWLARLRDRARDTVPGSAIAPEPAALADTDSDLCERLDTLFRSSRCYAEFGIGLDDVAKQLRVSTRQLSASVNRIHARGFRTLLNDYRVEDAARQLADMAMIRKPITEVMFDAGFQTKSNFNKEFGARHGVPPSQYRKQRIDQGNVAVPVNDAGF
jgi:AraC-like DNA-binding protein